MRTALQEVLEAETTEALGAEKGERAAGRQGNRSGTVDRRGRFSTELFERHQRSE